MQLNFDTNGNDKQKLCCRYWADPDVFDIVYGGSKGSGKSYLGCQLIFSDALTYPGTHYFIARKKLNDIRKFTIPSIYEVFQHWGVSPDYYNFNGQDNFYTLYNGSKVFLLDAKYLPGDPFYYRFGSMQITRGWIEEAGEFEEAAKSNLAASIGRWKNDLYNLSGKLLQTCNPAKNYLYRKYYKPYKDGTLKDWEKFIQALPSDNKCLPDGYIEHLKRTLPENEKQRLLYGNWEYDNDPAALIDYEKATDIFSNSYVEEGKRFITCDLARLGGDRIVIISWSGWRGYVQAFSKQKLDKTVQDLETARIKNRTGKSGVLCDQDGLGGGVVDLCNYLGFVNNSRPLPAPTDKSDKPQPENYDNLKSQCSFRAAEKISAGEVYLTCEDESFKDLIIEELEQVKQKSLDSDQKKGVTPKAMVKDAIGRSPDFWDTIMMRAYFDLTNKAGIDSINMDSLPETTNNAGSRIKNLLG